MAIEFGLALRRENGRPRRVLRVRVYAPLLRQAVLRQAVLRGRAAAAVYGVCARPATSRSDSPILFRIITLLFALFSLLT